MHQRLHVLLVTLVVLLTIVGLSSASARPFAAPARAQVVTPDPSPPSFANQQFVIVSDNITNPAAGSPPTFATGELADPSSYPVATVRVRNHAGSLNNQRLWLSVRIRQQDPDVEDTAAPGYAQMGLIAPGGEATYTVTFPRTPSARVEFEVDGSTDEAVMLTLLQFALEAGFTAADLTGLGGRDAEIGQDLAEVVAEQYLADLPTLVPCANAVAAVQRGAADQGQFERDVQGCLESPIWQASVAQMLARATERDWFQQSLNAVGKAVPEVEVALKAVKAGQFALQLWGMYAKFHPEVPGAMVGTVAFLSVDTTSRETPEGPPVPELSVYEVVGRAQAAIQEAGTYRFEVFAVDPSGRQLNHTGEVALDQGTKQVDASGRVSYTTSNGRLYTQQEVGTFLDTTPASGLLGEVLVRFLQTPATEWTLRGTEAYEGGEAYVVERAFPWKSFRIFETLWIDADTFLPLKMVGKSDDPESEAFGETIYADFGAAVDVVLPSAATAPSAAESLGQLRISVLVCASSAETRFSVFDQLINVDPGQGCRGAETPIRLTLAGPSGEVTPYETTGLSLDLPFGPYTVTEEVSGASTTFDLKPNEGMPVFCNDLPGCAWVMIFVPDDSNDGSSFRIAPAPVPAGEVGTEGAEVPPPATVDPGQIDSERLIQLL